MSSSCWGTNPFLGLSGFLDFQALPQASGYHPLARALKFRKTLKGVPSTINCRYKKFDFLLSDTFHFVRFLKFKVHHHVGEGTPFWKFAFSGLASEKSLLAPFKSRKTLKGVPFPYTLQIQEI
jgi:hypothetical protein